MGSWLHFHRWSGGQSRGRTKYVSHSNTHNIPLDQTWASLIHITSLQPIYLSQFHNLLEIHFTTYLPFSSWSSKDKHSEADSSAAGQEVPHLLWNPNIHCYTQKSKYWTLFWASLIQNLTTYFFKIHFNMFFPSMPRSSTFLQVFQQKIVCISSVPFLFSCPSRAESRVQFVIFFLLWLL
jgi:hypothetical protein